MGQHHEIHVIGAGLGGLASGALIARSGGAVVVHDSRARPGGQATTDTRAGFAWNQGPHALYGGGPAMAVLDRLGIAPRGVAPSVRGRAVSAGVEHIMPSTPTDLVRTTLLGRRDKSALARLLATIQHRDPADVAHISVTEWIDGLVRSESARTLLHALTRLGTYVNDPDTLSADVALLQLQRSVAHGVLYLDDGWQQLVDALAAVPGIVFAEPGPVTELPDAAAVIVAVGGPAAAGALLGATFDVGPAAQVSCLDLGISGAPTANFALGMDTPLYASRHSIARGHAPAGHASVTVAEYLSPGTEPDRERLLTFARHLGVDGTAIAARRYLHRMTAVTAMATPARGGLAGRPATAVADRAGVFVVGDWVGPDGHLADAVFASAEAAAAGALSHVAAGTVSR